MFSYKINRNLKIKKRIHSVQYILIREAALLRQRSVKDSEVVQTSTCNLTKEISFLQNTTDYLIII